MGSHWFRFSLLRVFTGCIDRGRWISCLFVLCFVASLVLLGLLLSSFWVLSLSLVFGDFISGLFNVLGRGPREKMVLVHRYRAGPEPGWLCVKLSLWALFEIFRLLIEVQQPAGGYTVIRKSSGLPFLKPAPPSQFVLYMTITNAPGAGLALLHTICRLP
jgi:hypothetical protein